MGVKPRPAALHSMTSLIKVCCRAGPMHKHSSDSLGLMPSAECCTPAQPAADAYHHQALTGSPAQNSNRCTLPSAAGPETPAQQAASLPASPPPSTSCHDHNQCQADVCCRAPALPLLTRAHHDRGTQEYQFPAAPAVLQHAQQGSLHQSVYSQSLSVSQSNQLPASISSSTGGHNHDADQKLLWWPLDHVTVEGSRLAVGDSCYVITGHCVVCKLNDELEMVECSRCKRFTHFACACPKLARPPQVCPLLYQ